MNPRRMGGEYFTFWPMQMFRRTDPRRGPQPHRDVEPRWLTLLPAALLALLLTGCAGHDDGRDDSGNIDVTDQSALINHNEHDFAQNPDLRADPDDIVTLQLEDPGGSYDDTFDTGDADGVDVVPYTFRETTERTFCWQVAGDESAGNGSGSDLRLMDDATGTMVLRVEEGGECVTQTIPAGHYSAHFHHGPNVEQERDLVFIVPQSGASSRTRQGSGAGPDENPSTEGDAQTPFCLFAVLTSPDYIPPFLPAALMRRQVLEGISFQYIPAGGCTDVSLIRDYRTPFNDIYQITLLPGFKARVYADLFFRGPRKTLTPAYPGAPGFSFLGPGSMVVVQGDPSTNKDWLIQTNGCDSCDLSGVTLDEVDLQGAWLRFTDLSHASLKNANLSRAFAQGTIFKSAYMEGADLHEADLTGATFDSAGPVDEGGQVYPAADLSNANLAGAVLTNGTLRGATLTGAMFPHAVLDGVDLRAVSAADAVFDDASMLSTQLSDATLTGAKLNRVNLDGMDLSRISAAEAEFGDASLRSAVLTNATLSRARFDKANLQGANLQGASLDEARLPEADLRGAFLNRERALQGAFLDEAYMYNVKLNNADLTGVSMRGATFYGPQALAQSARFDLARLDGAVLSGANFTQASFLSATLDGAACVNCQFNGAILGATASDFSDAASFVGTDVRGADFTNATVDGCRFTDAIVSLVDGGTYTYQAPGRTLYTTGLKASVMGAVRTSATVRCPDRSQGPCNTNEKLTARPPTPTATPRPPTPTPAAGCTPNIPRGIYCPTRTPAPVP